MCKIWNNLVIKSSCCKIKKEGILHESGDNKNEDEKNKREKKWE